MGPTCDANMDNSKLSIPVIAIIGKLKMHTQDYMDTDDLYIMPSLGCDVLLGMPWHYDHKAIIDTFDKTVTVTHRGKTKVLNVKRQGDFIPIVSPSAISSIMKNHLSRYLIFVKQQEPMKEGFTFKLEKS